MIMKIYIIIIMIHNAIATFITFMILNLFSVQAERGEDRDRHGAEGGGRVGEEVPGRQAGEGQTGG